MMKKIKTIMSLLLITFIAISFSACAPKNEENKEEEKKNEQKEEMKDEKTSLENFEKLYGINF